MDLDLVVANGVVVDGTGGPRFRADLGIREGRIEVIAREGRLARAPRTVDAAGLVVAPGFVDLDSHVDWALALVDPAPRLEPLLRQGVTTAIGGACGFSPAPALAGCEEVLDRASAFLQDGPMARRARTFGEFLGALVGDGLLLNTGFLAGLETIRAQVMRERTGPAREDELRAMLDAVDEALAAGALGVTANLAVEQRAEIRLREAVPVAAALARAGALLAVHARAYTRYSLAYQGLRGGPHNVRAIADVAELARRTGVRAHVLHVLLAGRRTWPTAPAVLAAFDAAAASGIDLSFDACPYHVTVGPLQLVFPEWFVAGFPGAAGRRVAMARLRAEAILRRVLLGMRPDEIRLRGARGDTALDALEGLSFEEMARRRGRDAVGAEVEVARRAGMTGASVLIGAVSGEPGHDEPLRALLAHRRCAFATNALPTRSGPQNPSATGAFPRILGRYCRDLALLPLEDAVRRMTSFPAERAGLEDVGRIAVGAWADLTVFDPATVADPAEPERPGARPSGIRAVLVSGEVAVRDGEVVRGVRAGRLLRRERKPLAASTAAEAAR